MRRVAIVAGLATLAFGVAQYLWPGYRSRLAGGWFGVLGAAALVHLGGELRRDFPLAPRGTWRAPQWVAQWAAAVTQIGRRIQRRPPPRPVNSELARMEGVVIEALATASGVQRRLRPAVRDIVQDRLAVAHGLQLDVDNRRVRAMVGDELWELIRPDRPFPVDGFAPGLSAAELASLLDRLETLGAAP